MVKATLRSAVLLAIVAIGMLAVSMPSFAALQDVKVGGDTTVRAFHRQNLDLNDKNNNTLTGHENWLSETTALNVTADLTQNASAFVRITNERDFGTTGTANGDMDISQAYIKLKELFYSPITLTLGAQPIMWGRGFVLGSNLLPGVLETGDDRNQAIAANEFTDFTAFDALRLQADFSGGAAMSLPLMVDAVYIKSHEGSVGLPDDANIMGLNIGTHMSAMGTEVEAYYLNKHSKNIAKSGDLNTMGLRGSVKPVEGALTWAELAYQFGQRRGTDLEGSGLPTGDSAQGWAANLGAEYTFAGVPTTPKLGAEWRFYSGKDIDGAFGGWQPVAPGYFTSALREFQTRSTNLAGFYNLAQTNVTGGQTNQHQFSVYASDKPLEDLTISPRLSWFNLNKGVIPCAGTAGCNGKRKNFVGTEWDTQVSYAYTEDVTFGVIYALFLPGNVFRTPNDEIAQEIVSSVSVKF